MSTKITLQAAVVNSGISMSELAQHFGVTRQAIWYRIKNYRKMRSKDLAAYCKIIDFDINGLDLEERKM